MENIKQDINNWIDFYLQDKGGDISPMQTLQLNNAIDQLARYLFDIIEQNNLKHP